MDRAKVKVISEDLRGLLEDFAKKHDLESVDFKNISYDAKGFRTTITATEKLDMETKQNDFDMKALSMGLPKGLFEKEFNFQGETYKVEEINTKARKYPIVATNKAGNRYKFAKTAVAGVEMNK